MNNSWKALASVAVAAALVIAPLGMAGASAADGADDTAVVADPAAVTEPAEAAPAAVVEEPAEATEEPGQQIQEPAAEPESESAAVESNAVEPAQSVTETETATIADVQTMAPEPEKKVFVCKYVGTPGDDERLQGGGNPINVSINAIPAGASVGAFFADAQGRSFVLAFDTGQDESSLTCPPGDGGEDLEVMLAMPGLLDLCGTENDRYQLPLSSAGVTYTLGVDGSIVATIADGYVVLHVPSGWTANPDGTFTYAFDEGDFTNVPCVPVPAQFNAPVTPPDCDSPGSFSFGTDPTPNVALSISPAYTGPGTYTLTATALNGTEFEGGGTMRTRIIVVEGPIGFQSTDPNAPCYRAEQPPIQVMLATPTITDVCGTENDSAELPASVTGVTYAWLDEEDDTELDIIAVFDEGYVPASLPAGWVATDEDGVYLFVQPDFTDVACPVVTPGGTPAGVTPGTTPTTTMSSPSGLAVTGGGGVSPIVPIGAAVALLLGITAAVYASMRRRV